MPFKTPGKTALFTRSLLPKESDDDIAAIAKYADERVCPTLLPETAAFLKQAVILKNPESILEIGTAIGFSAMIILKNCSGKLCTVEKDEASAAVATRFFERAGVKDRVSLFVGDAVEIVPLLSGAFDFIFLDGPKTRYPVFYPYLKKLLRSGGVLMADNVLFNGTVDGSVEGDPKKATIVEGLREYLSLSFSDPEMITSLLPVGDGVAFSVKK